VNGAEQVVVITAIGADGPVGMAVNSFTSVWLAPSSCSAPAKWPPHGRTSDGRGTSVPTSSQSTRNTWRNDPVAAPLLFYRSTYRSLAERL
jgi:hypothetical protein